MLDAELRKAHVIVIVYSIDLPGSFDRLAAWWLPYIRGQGVNVRRLTSMRSLVWLAC
jgi:mitochondrial Rho GTPase 1